MPSRTAPAAFHRFDLLVAPATPCPAPLAGAKTLALAGRNLPLRPSLGLLATPFSCIGLPVATVPLFGDDPMPVGVNVTPSVALAYLVVAGFLYACARMEAPATAAEAAPAATPAE